MLKRQGVAERKFHEREEKKKREVEQNTGDLLRGFDEAQAWLNGIVFAVIKGRRHA